MSLQPLEWRKLPVRTFQTDQTITSVLNTVYDMLTGSLYHDGSLRIVGSGSAWSASGRFITGSNTEAVYCVPPYKTTVSQSVIFAGKNVTGVTSSGNFAIATNGSTTANYLVAATVKNASGSFTQWTSLYPFGSGSYSTGYARIGPVMTAIGMTDRISIYESKEAIALFIYDVGTAINYGAVAGAIIDPEQSSPTSSLDAEIDGRIYGLASGGSGGLVSTFLTDASAASYFLSHGTGTSNAKFVVFLPGYSLTNTVSTEKYISTGQYYPTLNYTTLSGKFVKTPLKCCALDATLLPTYFLGRLREISVIKDNLNNSVIRNNSSGNTIGFVLSGKEDSATDSVMLDFS
jgi:hypothetical protein